MPAEPSSAIPAALIQLTHANPLQETEAPHLLAYLATISDPRGRRGRRHPLVAILAIAAAAVLAGARSMAAIAEWAADVPQLVRVALGARRDAPAHWVVPSEATIRRTLARLDAKTLAEVIGAWLADRDRPDQRRRRRAVAVDGKSLRGARRDGRAVHLLAAMEHATRRVLAQRAVNGALGEVPGFQPLLADLDLAGAVVTADALHAHAEAAQFLVTTKAADYLFTVKANQPTLLNRCARLAWQQVPVLDRTRHRAHGRVDIRTLKAVTVRGLGFPHASQVLQVTRKTRDLRSRRWRTVVVYAVTSLAHARASPARLADLLRGHWSIENGLHWVRDVTFTEDASQVRSGTALDLPAEAGAAGQGDRAPAHLRAGRLGGRPGRALDELYRVVEDLVLSRFPPEDPPRYIEVPVEPPEYRRAEARVKTLQERVLDIGIRALIERIVEVAAGLVRSGSRVTIHDQGKRLTELSGETHKRIGARLRHLYDATRLGLAEVPDDMWQRPCPGR